MVIPLIMVVDRALRDAGIPIDGVSIGSPNDRATWRADYTTAATSAQRTQGDQIVATIDPQDAATIANIKNDLAAGLTNRDELIALAQALFEAIPAPTVTLPQLKARFLVLLKARL